MKERIVQFLTCNGTTSRGQYTVFGFALFFAKFGVDSLVAGAFGKSWGLFSYLLLSETGYLVDLARGEVAFLATMLAIGLPFLFVGVSLTIRRLRDAQFPLAMVALIFIPIIKIPFFLFLCCLSATPRLPAYSPDISFQQNRRSRHGGRDALVSLAITAVVGFLGIWLSTNLLSSYGWTLFVGLPFLLGFLSVTIYCWSEARSLGGCIGISFFSAVLLGASLLVLGIEGAICLLMAAPLWSVLSLMGGLAAWAIFREPTQRKFIPPILPPTMLLFPLLLLAEQMSKLESPLIPVRTSIEINAPPETVWRNVVAFAELPPPTETLFRLGIAYPMKAEIEGSGVGAVRHCVFSTGAFTEPIEVWDEPRLLKFSVTSNPPPMEEWTPFHKIHPPHLDGFLASEGGQFLLTPLPNGRTRLEGTTWYRHHMFPAAYWKLWSDHIIHKIHGRVLSHIKQQSESPTPRITQTNQP